MTERRGTGVRAMLTPAVLVAVVVGVACTTAGGLRAGLPGAVAGMLATVLVPVFLLVGQLPVAQAARGRRGIGALLLLLGYLLRVLLLVTGYVALVSAGTPDRAWLGASVIAVALGWTTGTVWAWLRWRPPVVDVELPGGRSTDGGVASR